MYDDDVISNSCSTYTFKFPHCFGSQLNFFTDSVVWYSSNVIPCNRTNCFSSSNFFQASLNTIDPCMIVQERLAGNYDMPLRNFKNQFGVICAWVNEVDSLFYFGTRKN